MITAPAETIAAVAPAVVVDLRPWEYTLAAQVGAERFANNFDKPDAAHYDRGRTEDDRVIVACYVVPPEFRSVRVLGWVEGAEALAAGKKIEDTYYRVPIEVLSLRGVKA